MSIAAIIPAAGSGKRMNNPVEKQFLTLAGKPILVHALQVLENHPKIDHVVLALSKSRIKSAQKELLEKYGIKKVDKIVEGGEERWESVQNAFSALSDSDRLVLIHDAVRPFVRPGQIDAVIAAAEEHGAATLAAKISNTVKRAADGLAYETVDRKNLWSIQTPQVFKRDLLEKAMRQAQKAKDFGTDECYIVEKVKHTVKLVESSDWNLKITTPEDLKIAEKIMQEPSGMLRTGTGYDVHRLVEGRKLILGGVEISHPKGLLGHSDADVLCHAIGDALLGAIHEGDLGKHFPDSNKKYKDISSLELLRHIGKLVEEKGHKICNLDSTIVAQRPKVAPFIEKMRQNISEALGVKTDMISVKATTTEGLGFEGREEGISAQAVALVSWEVR